MKHVVGESEHGSDDFLVGVFVADAVDASQLEVSAVALVTDWATVVAVNHTHLVEPLEIVAGRFSIALSEVSDGEDLRGGSQPGDDFEELLADRPALG